MADNPWREIEAEWKGDTSFIGHNASGGCVQMGTIDDQPGVSPMELLLVSLAGCTGMDIAFILAKERQPLAAMKVRVRGKRAEDYPKVFTELEVIYLIWGDGLDPKAVERAIQLSEEKYCSVGLMLGEAVPIQSSYRLLHPGELA
jgi:putative redox protein